MRRELLAIAALTLALSACDSSTEPPAGDPPSFAVQVSGNITQQLRGITFISTIRDGFAEVDSRTGTRTSSDVHLITMVPEFGGPLVTLGLLGPLQLGTYRVHAAGTGIQPLQFYGEYSVPSSDGGRQSYSATTGTVTITSLAPIRGTFAFHSGHFVTWPPNPPIGTSVRSQPTSVDFNGSFTVKQRIE